MKPFLKLKSADEVEKIIFELPVLSGIKVPLESAENHFLKYPFMAPADLPGFRRSTMDGFAVRAKDVFGASETNPALLRIAGHCPVGKMPEFSLKEGEAAEIFTGSPLPGEADAVVMIEHSRPAGEGLIEIIRPAAPGMNIVERDEDAHKGEILIQAGKKLRAQEIGILAAFAEDTVEIVRPPRVCIISTGDEIVENDRKLEPGQIRDVNSWSLAALCRKNCAETVRMGVVGDDPESLVKMLNKAREQADLILLSGGSSAGMRDHTIEAFLSLPHSKILVHGVAISPGKPFILGMSGEVCLVGLPGHVTSALVCAHVFVEPMLRRMQGLKAPEPRAWFEATLKRSVASAQGRRDYIRCRLEKSGEDFMALPLISPSAVLKGLLEADGFIVCPENSEGLAKGQKVKVYPV